MEITAIATSTNATSVATLPTPIQPGRVPIRSWVPDLDQRTLAQATNLSNLPFALEHVALMPDAHAGYGMPIGGVLFAERAVVPYAIGVDIGCGVALAETDLTIQSVSREELDRTLAETDLTIQSVSREELDRTLAEIARRVPPAHPASRPRSTAKPPWRRSDCQSRSPSSRPGWSAPSTSSARWVRATTSRRCRRTPRAASS